MKKEILENQHRLINHSSIILVSSSHNNKDNIMTVAWYQVVDINPLLIGISIGLKRLTHELIDKSGSFGINVPTVNYLKETWKCGKLSGKEIDKYKACHFTKVPGKKTGLNLIHECAAHLECEVIFQHDFKSHTLFIGEVKGAYVQEDLFDKYWLIDEKELIFPFHLGGDNIITNLPEKLIVEWQDDYYVYL